MPDKIGEIRKLIVAIITPLIPALNQFGVPLPEFLTADWLNNLLLILTPVLVFFVPNQGPASAARGPTIVGTPSIVGVASLLIAALVLSGCQTPRPKIDSIGDAIVVTAADIETVAQTVRELCGNTAPDGPCLASAVIDTGKKNQLKDTLSRALASLRLANQAYEADEAVEAEDRLTRAQLLLTLIREELARLEN